MRALLLSFAILIAPAVAIAQQVTGTITATLDGQDRTWYITESPQMSQSDWKDYGYQMTVSLFGHTVENTTMSTKEALMIQFAVTNTNGTLNVMNPEVIYLSQGMTKAHLAKQEDGADVTLTAAETSGDRLMVEGTFQADLVFTEVMKRKKDPENVLNIAGTFKADIGPVR